MLLFITAAAPESEKGGIFPILARAMEKEGGKKRRGKREQKEGLERESPPQINNFAQLI